jgi:hypothetical protein
MAQIASCVTALAQQLSEQKPTASSIQTTALAFYKEYPDWQRELTESESTLLANALERILAAKSPRTPIISEAVQAATYALELDGGSAGPFKAELLRIKAHTYLSHSAHQLVDKASSKYTGSTAKIKDYKDALLLQARSAHALRVLSTGATDEQRNVSSNILQP